jgi:hypothetical protein
MNCHLKWAIYIYYIYFFIIHNNTIESSQGLALSAGSLNYIIDSDTYLNVFKHRNYML